MDKPNYQNLSRKNRNASLPPNVDIDSIHELFDHTEAASDTPEPLPAGRYTARCVHGELRANANGTPFYRLTFNVTHPEQYSGRIVHHNNYLTPDAMGISKRELSKQEVTTRHTGAINNDITTTLYVSVHQTDAGLGINRVERTVVQPSGGCGGNVPVTSPTPQPVTPHMEQDTTPAADFWTELDHQNEENLSDADRELMEFLAGNTTANSKEF